MKRILLLVLACVAAFACTNEKLETVNKVFGVDKAYMSITISDADALTRGTTSDPGYEYGSFDEHKVTSAHFYFYDDLGAFVAEASAWDGPDNTGNTSTPGTPDGNIEFNAANVVVLTGVEQKNYPKWLVTVLNKDDNFKPGATLAEMETKLSDDDGVGIQNKGLFTMSTTSYKDAAGATSRKTYFVTPLVEANFATEPIVDDKAAIPNPVVVYVERLAAKVTLRTDMTASSTLSDGTTLYQINTTVAGDPNSGNSVGEEKIYIKLAGWDLNATALRSNIVKNIDVSWADDYPGFIWNKAADFRSFWGKSFNYGKAEGVASGVNLVSDYLEYVNLKESSARKLNEVGKSDYCAENTNTSAVVSSNFPSEVTSILLKAVICDDKGNSLDMVRYNGVLFNKADFLAYVLNVMNQSSKLDYYRYDAAGKIYTQIGVADVKLVNAGDGQVKVALDVTDDLYVKDGTTALAAPANTFATDYSAIFKEDASGYNGGEMYYTIPVEHLNNAAVTGNTVPEGKYGIVRNHHYVVTVNKIEKLGKGIFDPDEKIVPPDPTDDENYYVGASVKILSWKLVSQSVDL